MQHLEEFVARLRSSLSQGVVLCLALTMPLWVVASSANAARAFVVAPTALSFVAVEGGSNPPTQSLSIVASDPTAASWSASSGAPWLQVIPLTGTTPTSAFVSANVADLAAGTYAGTILFVARGTGLSQVVSVSLTVIPQVPRSQ